MKTRTSKQQREFYEWLVEHKVELVKLDFIPKLVDFIVDRLYSQWFWEEDGDEARRRIKSDGFESPVEDWDYYDLVNEVQISTLNQFFEECKDLYSLKQTLWNEYLNTTKD